MIIPASLALRAPGLCGRLVRYIEDSAIYPQPQLSLAVALSMLGILKAHRVRSESNFRTNILSVGIAQSGAGKGHGPKVISKLLHAIDHGYLLSGRSGSSSGLVNSLATTGRKLITWDEFGLSLVEMTAKGAPAYKAGILRVLMDTFSAADEIYLGDELSNRDGKTPRVDIQEPCLCLYGMSTPIRFYESLSSTLVKDGFLPRLLIFEGNSDIKIDYKAYDRAKPKDNDLLISELKEHFPAFQLSHLPTKKPIKTLTFDGASHVTFACVLDQYETLKLKTESEASRAIYSRAVEHFVKLCLIVEDPGSSVISYTTATFCADLLDCLMNTSIEAVQQNIFDSKSERDNSRLTEIVRKAKVISRSDLTRRTQYLKSFERRQIVEDLIDADIIESFFDTTGPERKKRTQFYRIRS